MDFKLLYNKVIVAVVIVLVGVIIGKLAQRITLRFMKELEINYLFKKTTKLKVSLDRFVSSAVKYLIYFVSLISVLNSVGFLFWTLIAGGIFLLLFLTTGIFLCLISLFPNLFARLNLRKNQFGIGRYIEVKNIKGKIRFLSFQFIFLENGVAIPYYYLFKNKFKLF